MVGRLLAVPALEEIAQLGLVDAGRDTQLLAAARCVCVYVMYVCMYVCSFLRKMKGSTAEAGGPPPREAERERKREREEEGEKGRERDRDPQGHLNKNPPH